MGILVCRWEGRRTMLSIGRAMSGFSRSTRATSGTCTFLLLRHHDLLYLVMSTSSDCSAPTYRVASVLPLLQHSCQS